MAISDVLVEVFILTVYASEVKIIPMNLRLCQVGNYIRGVSQSVSISSLVLITLDRYMAIVYPLKTAFRTLKARAIPLFLSWLLPIGFCLPLALKTKIVVDGNETFCSLAMSKTQDSRIFLGGGFVFLFILPLIAIIVLYSLSMRNLRQRSELNDLKSKQARAVCREKNQRILKMVVIIVIAFVICWGLFFIVKLIPSMATQKSCHILRWLSSHIFPSLSAALNPIILFVFSTNFKLALKSLIPRIFSAFCKCVCKVGPMKQSPRTDTTRQVISEHTDTKL
ncbi:PREDICTED: allatostatin-A receptor-like [Acropora digitifera]|uniref:allatostatin-A receptor-like n=1 Tax=Acropora digitifera TaxID=70779 RepID=UPI00077A8D54|nr:PREDICTED: allatostatin-A receptor-like [Acropora digitifera]XP_015778926.1 PREDICTED: allatostatin-A receptor-like [Acropora digitifera]XP_015778932.1 PREDICTED: allatostatin-A receptor-like [Acropora digitifera]XP_015778940.1 PREDICTED: allatostatin-A receptor-like [Acropora digitifera]